MSRAITVHRKLIYILTNIGRTCLSSNLCTNETMLIKGTKACIQTCPRNTHAIIKKVCTNILECLETTFYKTPNMDTNAKRNVQMVSSENETSVFLSVLQTHF